MEVIRIVIWVLYIYTIHMSYHDINMATMATMALPSPSKRCWTIIARRSVGESHPGGVGQSEDLGARGGVTNGERVIFCEEIKSGERSTVKAMFLWW